MHIFGLQCFQIWRCIILLYIKQCVQYYTIVVILSYFMVEGYLDMAVNYITLYEAMCFNILNIEVIMSNLMVAGYGDIAVYFSILYKILYV